MIDDNIRFRHDKLNTLGGSSVFPINITSYTQSSPNNFKRTQLPGQTLYNDNQTANKLSTPNQRNQRIVEIQKSETKDSNKKSAQAIYRDCDSFENSESEDEKEVIEDEEIVGKEKINNVYGLVVNKLKLKNNPSRQSNEKRSKKSSVINESRAKEERNSIYEFANDRVFRIGSIKDDKSISQKGSFGFSRNNNLEFNSNQKTTQFKNDYGLDIQNRRQLEDTSNNLYHSLYNNITPKQLEPKYSTGRNVLLNDFHTEIANNGTTSSRLVLIPKNEFQNTSNILPFAHFDDENLMKEYQQTISVQKSNLDNSIHKPQIRTKIEIPYVGVYEGEIENECLNGYGRLFDEHNQLLYEGEFINNNFNGLGILYNVARKNESDWARFEGVFLDNKKEGFGTSYFSNDQKQFGFYKNDELVNEE